MLFDKIIWNSVSPVRKDSTYVSLEYVINDLGIYCKGEIRCNDVGFATSRIGSPIGLTAVDGAEYAAKPLGRVAILWNKITDIKDDVANGTIVVFGNANDRIVMKHEASEKNNLLSRIDSMRRFCASSPISDEAAAAWKSWAADTTVANPFAPLDELIEAERTRIEQRTFTDSQLDSVVLPVSPEPEPAEEYVPYEPSSSYEPAAEVDYTPYEAAEEPSYDAPAPAAEEEEPVSRSTPKQCPHCGAPTLLNAIYCIFCGEKV